MKDLKIKPGMDTPKAKLKNPAPKDADSLLKKHMDKRQREKEPESHDPVRYATDRVEKNMRHGASGAADASRRMIKHYRGKLRQGKDNAAREYRVADMGIGAESGSTNAPTEYDFSPAQPTARNEVGKQTFSPQNPNAAKNASAAPQERGRKKAAQDAKAAYRRNLAEKRTAERHIVPPPSDRGGMMPPPQTSIPDTATKNGSMPKRRQSAFKTAHRTAHTSSTAEPTQPIQSLAQRAQAAAQRKAQRAMLQDSVKNGGNAAKKLGGTAVQAIKVVGRGVASAVSSILSAGGGAVVLVLFLTVILVAAIVASPFGILFSNESREAGVVPISAAVAQVNYDFNAKLEALQTVDDYRNLIFRLMALPISEDTQTLYLSEKAFDLMADYFQEHERFLAGEGQAISDWASKYIGAVLRIAGLLHGADMDDGENEISASTVSRAIQIGKYFLAHSTYAYSMMGTDLSIQKAKFVMAKLKKKNVTMIKRSDLFQMCRGKFFKKTEEIFPTLELLEGHGYLRMEEPERQSAGRPADVRIFVNPAAA